MRKLLFILSICFSAIVMGQEVGTIQGTLMDKDMVGEPLAFANVYLEGTTTGVTSDFDGNYIIENVPVGDYVLVFSYVGYETVKLPVVVKANEAIVMNGEMGMAGSLEAIEITVQTSREKEEAILMTQRESIEIRQEIGAIEMSRKGASNIAAAVAKTTGVSKQEGSGDVYVRGLGDRYNLTSMNGLPLPSNNPSNKNIDLGIFNSEIVQSVSIDKVFNANNFADFAGASVDIITKDYRGKGFFEVGIETGFNSAAQGTDNFRLQDGPSRLGFNLVDIPNNPLAGYNFNTSWNPEERSPLNFGLALRGGDRFNVGEDGKISIFANLSHDNSYRFQDGFFRSSVSQQGFANKDFQFLNYSFGTNTTGMLNLSYKMDDYNKRL